MATAATATKPETPLQRLKPAYEQLGNHPFSAVEFTIIKVFCDFQAWDVIPDEGDVSVKELADKIGGTFELIDRFCTFLLSGKILTSPSEGRVAHTDKSRIYKSDQPLNWLVIHMYNNVFRSLAQMPDYFLKYGLASPQNVRLTPLGLAHGHDDKPAYELIVANKKLHKGFNEALRELGSMYSLKGVYDFGWMREGLATDEGRPALVDIGGSHGLAIRDAVKNNNYIPAENCILFDLPEVIANTEANLAKENDEYLASVQKIGGSMFEPFPEKAKGALIYQYRRVLNDFPDEDVVRTWKNIRETAVAPDTRILVIEEMLSPKRIPMNVCLDICLMCAAGKRRNAAMFTELAEKAGFKFNAEFRNINSQFDDFSVLEFVVA